MYTTQDQLLTAAKQVLQTSNNNRNTQENISS